jgi:hypothetical protein
MIKQLAAGEAPRIAGGHPRSARWAIIASARCDWRRGGQMMNFIARLSILAILAGFFVRPPFAAADDVSLIGSWQLCEADNRCDLRMAFMPNGKVIKQYSLMGATVTAYGNYRMNGRVLEVIWTGADPKRVCASHDKMGLGKKCVQTTEPNARGEVEFTGFNALVWSVAGRPPLRLVRREE